MASLILLILKQQLKEGTLKQIWKSPISIWLEIIRILIFKGEIMQDLLQYS